jgi:hypothetical protein
MKHFILVNHHQIFLPGFRDLIKELRGNNNFVISRWGSKSFIDPQKSKYKSISLMGNFQKLDDSSNPLRVPDYNLLDFWATLKGPRIWISSMVDLHLGINQMLFGKNTLSTFDGKQIAINSFSGLAWSYEHNSFTPENKSNMNVPWVEFWSTAAITHEFLINNFKNRLDFPWAINFPNKRLHLDKKKYDFCIPGARYPTRIAIEDELSKTFKLAPYQQSDHVIRSAVDIVSRVFPPIRSRRVEIKKKLREMNMNRLLTSSNFSYVDGGPLRYFVRKYLEVTVSGSTLVCPPSYTLKMYGFIENKHFIDINFFLQNSREGLAMSTKNNLKSRSSLSFLRENHDFNARINQLYSFLESLSINGLGLGVFSNGTFVLHK